MIDRFEKVLHIHYGQVEYWKVINMSSNNEAKITRFGQFWHVIARQWPEYSLTINSQEQMGSEHQNQSSTDFKNKNWTGDRKCSLKLRRDYSAATGAT